MTNLYVVGGQQRRLRSLKAGAHDWYEYQKGVILCVSPSTRHVATRLEYTSPPESCAPQDPIILFKSGTLQDDLLYTCTQTEVIIYRVPSFRRVGYVSLPSFNDVHHVRPLPNGHLLVANTGLDMVMELTWNGDVVREWSALGETDPWARFSRTIDYRKGISTKPHPAHPNYVFCIEDELWTTRFQQKDAICLTNPARKISINIDRVHDGVLHDGLLYFTTVNGNVVVVRADTLKTEAVIDLNTMHPEGQMLGWCRSIWIDGSHAWIGFSRLRPTRWRENVSWVLQGFKDTLPTRIACYDLVNRRCLTEIELESHGLNAVFGVFPAPAAPLVDAHTAAL